jgi:3D (Asp-Asp-Asp) domain-containing protein
MNIRRIKFAFFISVFILCGCASTSSVAIDYNIDNPVVETQSSAMVEEMQFLSFESRGELRTAAALEEKGAPIKEKYRRLAEEERKRQEEIRKQKEKEARTFYPYTTTYGVDCYGCSGVNGRGGTAHGIVLDVYSGVLVDGEWQPGIKYGPYYIIAADPSIPMCSIIKISNHGLSGAGLSPDEPYYAIVLDRGGAIHGNHLDLYTGSEKKKIITKVKNTQAVAEIMRYGGSKGYGSCNIE